MKMNLSSSRKSQKKLKKKILNQKTQTGRPKRQQRKIALRNSNLRVFLTRSTLTPITIYQVAQAR